MLPFVRVIRSSCGRVCCFVIAENCCVIWRGPGGFGVNTITGDGALSFICRWEAETWNKTLSLARKETWYCPNSTVRNLWINRPMLKTNKRLFSLLLRPWNHILACSIKCHSYVTFQTVWRPCRYFKIFRFYPTYENTFRRQITCLSCHWWLNIPPTLSSELQRRSTPKI